MGPLIRRAPARLVTGVRSWPPEAERRPQAPPLRTAMCPPCVDEAELLRVVPERPSAARFSRFRACPAAPACDGEGAVGHESSSPVCQPCRMPTAVADREAAAERHGAGG